MARESPHDALLAIYRRQPLRPMPIGIYARYLPRGEAEREVRNAGLGVIDYYPAVSMLAPPWHLLPGYLSEVRNCTLEVRFSWQDGQFSEIRSFQTPVGTISEWLQKDPTYGSDWIKKFYIECEEDYKIMQYVVENVVFSSNHAQFKKKQQDLGADGLLLARLDRSPYQKLLIELAGPERFLADLAEDHPPLLELMEVMEFKLDEAFGLALESPAEAFWQPDNITADMTPPRMFSRYCIPFYERRCSKLRTAGKPYVVHMDGRLKPLKELIAAGGIDCIESFSLPEVGGDLSLAEALDAWPDRAVAANFPAPLCLGDDAEIAAFAGRILSTIADRSNPFMLQVSEDIPADSWKRVLPILLSFPGW